ETDGSARYPFETWQAARIQGQPCIRVSTLLWARSKLYRRRHSQPVLLSPCCYNDEGVAVVANYCAHRGKIGFILEQIKPSVAGQVAGRRRIPRDPVVRRLQQLRHQGRTSGGR